MPLWGRELEFTSKHVYVEMTIGTLKYSQLHTPKLTKMFTMVYNNEKYFT
jgi:hypothetical protein